MTQSQQCFFYFLLIFSLIICFFQWCPVIGWALSYISDKPCCVYRWIVVHLQRFGRSCAPYLLFRSLQTERMLSASYLFISGWFKPQPGPGPGPRVGPGRAESLRPPTLKWHALFVSLPVPLGPVKGGLWGSTCPLQTLLGRMRRFFSMFVWPAQSGVSLWVFLPLVSFIGNTRLRDSESGVK